MPDATGCCSPQIPCLARLSRLGLCAASSSVLLSDCLGSPPRPSMTRNIIFVCAGLIKGFRISKSIGWFSSFFLVVMGVVCFIGKQFLFVNKCYGQLVFFFEVV